MPPASGPPPRKSWLGLTVRVAVTVGVSWYLLSVVPVGAVLDALGGATPAFVVAGMAAQILVRVLNALRIQVIAHAQGAPLPYGAILSMLLTTGFYALLLPGSIGGGAATLVKYLGYGVAPAVALASMLVNRLIDTMTVVAVGLFWWGLDHRTGVGGLGIGEVLVAAAPIALLAFHLLVFGRARALRRIADRARSASLERYRLYKSFLTVLERCGDAGNVPRRAAIGVAVQSILQDLVASAAAFCFAHAVGIDLSFVTIAWMRAAVSILMLLPVSFSGVGVRESALVLMTKTYGVAASVALAWSLLQLCGLLFVALIGALIEARVFWRRSSMRT
jgi:uncharacterized protein (TIRG00374 family)